MQKNLLKRFQEEFVQLKNGAFMRRKNMVKQGQIAAVYGVGVLRMVEDKEIVAWFRKEAKKKFYRVTTKGKVEYSDKYDLQRGFIGVIKDSML